MTAQDGRDRRTFPRFRASLFISLGVGREKAVSAKVVNISRVGILCVVEESVECPAAVVAMINIPGAYPIEVEGRIVRWRETQGGRELAIEVSRIGEEDVPVLEQFLLAQP